MLSIPKLLLPLLALATTTLADLDIYATFKMTDGSESVAFDMTNTGCFGLTNAAWLEYDSGGGGNVMGPEMQWDYCLSYWPQSGCQGQRTGWKNVNGIPYYNTWYSLAKNEGDGVTGSFKWSVGAC